MKFAIEKIGPERAKSLLAKTVKNRPLNTWTIDKYAMDMTRGAWMETGDTLKINQSGELIDGQHRLEAVIKSGEIVTFAVAYDVPDVAFDSVDIGRNRKASDVLALQGYKNCNTLAAAARLLYLDERGLLDGAHPSLSGTAMPARYVSNRDVLNTIEQFPDLVDCTHAITTIYRYAGQLLNYGLAAYVLYKCRLASAPDADKFFSGLTDGVDLQSDSPLHLLRERLIRNQADKRKLERRELYAYTVKSWNAFRANETFTATRLRLRTAGPAKESSLLIPQ